MLISILLLFIGIFTTLLIFIRKKVKADKKAMKEFINVIKRNTGLEGKFFDTQLLPYILEAMEDNYEA